MHEPLSGPLTFLAMTLKTVSLDSLDWSALVNEGDSIAASGLTSEPLALMGALADAAPHGGRFSLFLGTPFSDVAARMPPATVLTTYGGIGSAGAMGRNRRMRISLQHFSRCAEAFETGLEPVDLALVSLARGRDGRLYLGGSWGITVAAARRAKRVVVEINDQAPVIHGGLWPDDIAITAAIEVSYPIVEAAEPRATATDLAIAAHIAPLVPEAACLQVGIGAMPSAILASLKDHRHLSLHSGMYTVPVHRLVESGALDNSRKTLDRGVSVTATVYGDAAMYRAVNDDARLGLREPAYTHSLAVMAQMENFTAINSSLEVDLLGQANAETVPGADGRVRYIGGIGGLNDFVRGARNAKGGQAMIALPSRQSGKDGPKPRIVAALSGPATISAADADLVITEFGVARLRDASVEERARRMIAIAHPEDREALTAAARQLGHIA